MLYWVGDHDQSNFITGKNETIEMKSNKISTLPVAEANTVLGSVVFDQAMSLLSLSLKKCLLQEAQSRLFHCSL